MKKVRSLLKSKPFEMSLGIIGIFLTVIGYHLDKADENPWIQRLFTPSYCRAMDAFNQVTAGKTLSTGDLGFKELVALIQPNIKGSGDLSVSGIRINLTGNFMNSTTQGMDIGSEFTLEIRLRDNRSITAPQFRDLRPQIRECYYLNRMKLWSKLAFGSGIAITTIMLLLSVLHKE